MRQIPDEVTSDLIHAATWECGLAQDCWLELRSTIDTRQRRILRGNAMRHQAAAKRLLKRFCARMEQLAQ